MEEDHPHASPSTSSTDRPDGERPRDAEDHPENSAAFSSSFFTAAVHEEEGGGGGGGGVVVVDEEEEEEEDRFRHHEIEHQHQHQQQQQQLFGFNFRRNNFIVFEDASSVIRDDTWSCVIVVLTFWFFGQSVGTSIALFWVSAETV